MDCALPVALERQEAPVGSISLKLFHWKQHGLDQTFALGKDKAIMTESRGYDGQLSSIGSPEDLKNEPQTPETASIGMAASALAAAFMSEADTHVFLARAPEAEPNHASNRDRVC